MKHEITAKITYTPNEGNVICLANLEIDGDIVISGVRMLEGKKGRFLSMPQRKSSNGEYFDIAFPLSGELREQMLDAVEEAYHEDDASEEDEKDRKPARSASKKKYRR